MTLLPVRGEKDTATAGVSTGASHWYVEAALRPKSAGGGAYCGKPQSLCGAPKSQQLPTGPRAMLDPAPPPIFVLHGRIFLRPESRRSDRAHGPE